MELDWNSGALAQGLKCFSRQEFFGAHEHWEIVWLKCAEPQKSFLQALIQVASAFHHHQRNNLRGAASLLRRALHKLEHFPAHFEQIDVAELRSELSEWMRALETSHKVFSLYPRIRVIDRKDEKIL